MIDPTTSRNMYMPGFSPGNSPLMMDGWAQFNEETWGVTARPVRFSVDDSGAAAVEAVLYLNKAGRLVLPPLTPYLPVIFTPASPGTRMSMDRQWSVAGQLLARDMRERGLRQAIPLPPYMPDIRPWQQANFGTNVKYTYYMDLPYQDSSMRKNVRRSIAHSQRKGFLCERTANLEHLHECLLQTEERQGFSHGLEVSDLRVAQSLLGEDAFRVYVCYAPDGEAVSATVELHQPGETALGWVAGTKTAYLTSGVSQHLLRFVLDDLHAAGAVGYDFVGAGIPSVAAFKAQWGPKLMPYFAVDGGGRAFARRAKQYVTFKRDTP